MDISAKRGKIRARKVNFLQNSAVVTQPYPLKFKVKEPAKFFEKRESWKVKDFLFNPMVSIAKANMTRNFLFPSWKDLLKLYNNFSCSF